MILDWNFFLTPLESTYILWILFCSGLLRLEVSHYGNMYMTWNIFINFSSIIKNRNGFHGKTSHDLPREKHRKNKITIFQSFIFLLMVIGVNRTLSLANILFFFWGKEFVSYVLRFWKDGIDLVGGAWSSTSSFSTYFGSS